MSTHPNESLTIIECDNGFIVYENGPDMHYRSQPRWVFNGAGELSEFIARRCARVGIVGGKERLYKDA